MESLVSYNKPLRCSSTNSSFVNSYYTLSFYSHFFTSSHTRGGFDSGIVTSISTSEANIELPLSKRYPTASSDYPLVC